MTVSAALWIDPCRMGGQPCINGTRIPVYAVAEVLYDHGHAEVFAIWPDLTERDVLVACWWHATSDRKWWKRWGAWADSAHGLLRDRPGPLGAWPPTAADIDKGDTP